MKVLFLCSGNICRSPMAAEYMRHRAARSNLSHLVIESAGVLGINDAPASAEAVRVLSDAGLDLSGHRSRGLRSSDLRTTDIIVAMGLEHLEFLEHRFPESPELQYLIRAFENGPEPQGGAPDLEDPMGHELAVYRRQFELIRTCVDHLVMHLRHEPA